MSGELREFAWRTVGRKAFALSFHNWYGVRRAILRVFGATVAPVCRIRPSVVITHPWNFSIGHESAIGDLAYIDCTERVDIGEYCTVSQHAKVLTSLENPVAKTNPPQTLAPTGDGASEVAFVSHGMRGPVRIENDGWVAADSMVLPGVTVGEGAILGARATARESLAPWTTFGGEPLRTLGPRARPAVGA